MRPATVSDLLKSQGKLTPQVLLLEEGNSWYAVVVVDVSSLDAQPITATVQEVALDYSNRYSAEKTEEYNDMLLKYMKMDPSCLPRPLNEPPTWTVSLSGSSAGNLFCDVTSPDVVARLERGKCWFCYGTREICAGCTRGVAQEFDLFMSCGTDLACPNCMGIDIALEDKTFQQRLLGYARPNVTAHEIRERTKHLNARLAELGYPPMRWRDAEADEMDAEAQRTQS
ncbi:hypothetical protein CALVIDRAFT_563485 [Calocera viscosa TUFC12733]|uniref:Uncharacterized protein n=1 Tax=Calocera viscosa (strain TUFC12733) TaxID=1330018 RepID=A0A167MLF6_CALVF|nr:hypothetical protein CALVIDRAFT_563485 [Calocera viscosa TUFC12733]